MEISTTKSKQTKQFGEFLAKKLIKIGPRKKALVLGLEGDLGGGKTTFLQGFAKGLGVKQKILSPTFLILKKFKIPSSKFKIFYHFDCYRVEKPKEILNLGYKEVISNPRHLVCIEWADKIRKIMPKEAVWLKFKILDKNKRKIFLKYDRRKKINYY